MVRGNMNAQLFKHELVWQYSSIWLFHIQMAIMNRVRQKYSRL